MKKLLDVKNERTLLIGLFVVALLLRLWINLAVHKPGDFIQSDMWVYNHRAGHLIDREGNAWDTFTPIGYPAMLALIFKFAGNKNFVAVGIVQAFMGAGVVTLSHLLARRVSRSYGVALATGLVVAFYPPLIFYGSLCLTEVPFCFLMLLGTYALIRAADTSGDSVEPNLEPDVEPAMSTGTKPWVVWVWLAVCGVSLSLGNAIRSNLALFFPLLPLFVWITFGRDLKKTAIFTAKVVAFMLPALIAVSVHMSGLAGKFVPFSTNGGLNFFLAHGEYIGVRYKDEKNFAHTIVPIPNLVRYKDYYESPAPLYDEKHYYSQAFAILKAKPYRLLIALDNVLEGIGLGKQDYWPGWKGHEQLLAVSSRVFSWVVLMPVVAYFLALVRLKRLLLPEEAPRLLMFLHMAAILVTLYTFLGDPRMRVPFDPMLLLLFFDGIRRSNLALAMIRNNAAELALTREKLAILDPQPEAESPVESPAEDEPIDEKAPASVKPEKVAPDESKTPEIAGGGLPELA